MDIASDALKNFESQAHIFLTSRGKENNEEWIAAKIINLNDFYCGKLNLCQSFEKQVYMNYGYFTNFTNYHFFNKWIKKKKYDLFWTL